MCTPELRRLVASRTTLRQVAHRQRARWCPPAPSHGRRGRTRSPTATSATANLRRGIEGPQLPPAHVHVHVRARHAGSRPRAASDERRAARPPPPVHVREASSCQVPDSPGSGQRLEAVRDWNRDAHTIAMGAWVRPHTRAAASRVREARARRVLLSCGGSRGCGLAGVQEVWAFGIVRAGGGRIAGPPLPYPKGERLPDMFAEPAALGVARAFKEAWLRHACVRLSARSGGAHT